MTQREQLIDLMIEAKRTEPDGVPFSEWLADHLLDNGITIRQSGRWFVEKLPTPPNAKNTTMEHYRLVCPFCGMRAGKKKTKYCADCGAILR